MKVFVFLATLALVSAKSIKIDQIDYGFCDGADSSVGSIDTIEVTPFPIQIHTGASLSILAQLTLAQEVPAGAKVKLDIKKEGLIPLPIPCLEIEGLHIGSCEYLADDLLARFADFMCPAHVPDGQTCATPLMPGVYGGEPAIETVLPELPDILVDLIGAGTYEAKATIKNPDDSEMTCIYVRVELA